MKSVRAIFALIFAFIVTAWSFPASGEVRVSTSIKPLQLITAAIMDGAGTPGLVLGAAQDSHSATLRPSGRRQLSNAELVLWLGPVLEGSLTKVMPSLNSEVITIQDLTGLELGHLNVELADGVLDPHIWLNTENARIIAQEIAAKLIQLDEPNETLYNANLLDFENVMNALDDRIKRTLAASSDSSYAVYHNALQYFERQYGLQHVLSFTELEESSPGIRQLLMIKRQLLEQEVNCILVEPGINTNELASILENEQIRYLLIDIMGNDYPVEKGSYKQLIQSLSETMLECLH